VHYASGLFYLNDAIRHIFVLFIPEINYGSYYFVFLLHHFFR